ncbi:hypothetical protein SprV_0902778700 [Sparganum proliferum]
MNVVKNASVKRHSSYLSFSNISTQQAMAWTTSVRDLYKCALAICLGLGLAALVAGTVLVVKYPPPFNVSVSAKNETDALNDDLDQNFRRALKFAVGTGLIIIGSLGIIWSIILIWFTVSKRPTKKDEQNDSQLKNVSFSSFVARRKSSFRTTGIIQTANSKFPPTTQDSA